MCLQCQGDAEEAHEAATRAAEEAWEERTEAPEGLLRRVLSKAF